MKINFKIVIPILVVIALSWASNVYMFIRYSISSPILINSYLARPLYENTEFDIYYITNIYDKDKVCTVSFPELKTAPVDVNVNFYREINNSNYAIYDIHINVGTVFLENGKRFWEAFSNQKTINFSKVIFTTLKGKTLEYNLGEICLFRDSEFRSNSIKNESSMSSSDNYSSTIFRLNSDIKLTDFESPLKQVIPEICNININGIPVNVSSYSGGFKAGEEINIGYKIKAPKEMPAKYRYANLLIPLSVKGVDSSNKPCRLCETIYGNSFYNLSAGDIRKIINESR